MDIEPLTFDSAEVPVYGYDIGIQGPAKVFFIIPREKTISFENGVNVFT